MSVLIEDNEPEREGPEPDPEWALVFGANGWTDALDPGLIRLLESKGIIRRVPGKWPVWVSIQGITPDV